MPVATSTEYVESSGQQGLSHRTLPMNARTSPEVLEAILAPAAAVVDEARRHLTDQEVSITAVDAANAAMVDLALDISAFDDYDLPPMVDTRTPDQSSGADHTVPRGWRLGPAQQYGHPLPAMPRRETRRGTRPYGPVREHATDD